LVVKSAPDKGENHSMPVDEEKTLVDLTTRGLRPFQEIERFRHYLEVVLLSDEYRAARNAYKITPGISSHDLHRVTVFLGFIYETIITAYPYANDHMYSARPLRQFDQQVGHSATQFSRSHISRLLSIQHESVPCGTPYDRSEVFMNLLDLYTAWANIGEELRLLFGTDLIVAGRIIGNLWLAGVDFPLLYHRGNDGSVREFVHNLSDEEFVRMFLVPQDRLLRVFCTFQTLETVLRYALAPLTYFDPRNLWDNGSVINQFCDLFRTFYLRENSQWSCKIRIYEGSNQHKLTEGRVVKVVTV
jgi:hypothetical protein